MTQKKMIIPAKKRKIVYIDDVNYNLIAFNKALGKYYEIYLGESALYMYKILETVMPDIIILDVNMPNVDGYDLIKDLKNDKRYCEIPVIFLTSNIDRKDIVKGLGLGAVDYILKPFNAEKVIDSIEKQFHIEADIIRAAKQNAAQKRRENILIIDDIPSMLRTIHHALHNKYEVHLLSNPEVVVDFLRSNKIDLILLDYLMPVMNGFDLIPKIRGMDGYEITPIIIITSEGTAKNVRDSMLLGASDFIAKPFEPDELNYKVDRQLRLAKEMREKLENDFLLN